MKYFIQIVFVFLFCVVVPVSVLADIIINEIAWMGTENSANDEWIELYNNSTEQVILDEWKLVATDGSPTITLSGIITGGSFFILERSDESTLPGITADIIYTGSLSNSGEVLQLKNESGQTMHEVKGSQGWTAGDNTTKNTMQWNGTSWITSVPTPKAKNGTENIEPSSSGSANDTDIDTSINTESKTSSGSVVPSVHISPLPLSDVLDIRKILISAGTKRVVTVGQNVPFFAFQFDKDEKRIKGGIFSWAFGDGGSATGEAVNHTYYYPGTYVVALNANSNDEEAVTRTEVLVIKPELEIVILGKEGDKTFVEVKNKSSHDINLYEWELLGDNTKSFIFPKDTILKAHSSVQYPEEITGVFTVNTARLLNSQKKETARFEKRKEEKTETLAVISLETPIKTIVPVPTITVVPVPNKKVTKETEEITSKINTDQTALASESFTVEKTQGPFMRLLLLPVRLARSIGNLF